MKCWFHWLATLFFFLITSLCWGQRLDKILIPQMENYELDIQDTYQEYQKIYYEKKSSLAELRAFEDIISVYVSQILEIYETLSLSGFENLETPRDIAARALVYRALIFLEKAPLNVEFYEKACYDYFQALEMFNGVENIHVLFKQLPDPIHVGANKFNRLIDAIDSKGHELYAFGKVRLNLKNFKITTNIDIDDIEFVRLESPVDKRKYTYHYAENLIKDAFRKIFIKDSQNNTFLALSEGTYFIRSKTQNNVSKNIFLSSIFVRAKQQQDYIVEPLVDWFIMYENPTTHKPKFISSNSNNLSSVKINDEIKKRYQSSADSDKITSINEIIALSEKVNSYLEKVENNLIFNLSDTQSRNNFTITAAEVILSNVKTSNYYNCWGPWMFSWVIAKEITQKFSPKSIVPTELIKLIHHVLKEF